MANEIDVQNPLAGAGSVPMAATGQTTNPLDPGTTPASMSVTGTPANPAGVPQPAMPSNPLGMAPAPQPKAPPAPGTFAAKLLQAIGGVLSGANSALSNLGNAADPNGKGPLSGVEQTMARYNAAEKAKQDATNAQKQKDQERQDKLSLQEKQEKRADDEAASRIATANVQKYTTLQSDYRLGTDYMQKQVAQDLGDLKTLEEGEVPAQVVQRGINGDQLTAMLQSGKINPHDYTIKRSGVYQEGIDDNGNPKMAYKYDVVKPPAVAPPLSESQIARIRTVPGYENYAPGTQLTGAQAEAALTQADAIRTTHDLVDAARVKSGLDELTTKQKADAAEFVKQNDWQRFLNAYSKDGQIDMVGAAAHMLQDPGMRQKYGTSLYNDIMSQFVDKNDPVGTQNYDKMFHEREEEKAKREENAIKKTGEAGFEGDQTLTGEAFLRSMKQPKEAGLVKQAGDGQMNASNLAAMMRGKSGPDFMEAVARYAPDFQGEKVPAYYKAFQEYNDDKAGSVGGALNAAGTALKTLRRLYDSTTAMSLVPSSEENKQRSTDAANAAIEVAKFQAGGRQPGKDDIAAIRSALDPTIAGIPNPINRRAAVKEQAELIQKKIQEYEDNWHQKAPSPRYESPMPNISNAARIDSSYILNDGKYAVPRGAEGFTDPKTNHQIFTFDGKQFYDASNGQLVNPMTPGAR